MEACIPIHSARGAPAAPGTAARNPAARALRAVERAFDQPFGAAANPLRQLGALAFWFFWIVAVSGVYLYIFFDTSVSGAYSSVESLTRDQWYAGGVMRSLHRYASDAFLLVTVLHLVRELVYGRFNGFRWFSWVSGVPTLVFMLASGIVGYWLVWDAVAQFVGVGVTEWVGWLPGFGPGLVPQLHRRRGDDRPLLSLLVFIHLGAARAAGGDVDPHPAHLAPADPARGGARLGQPGDAHRPRARAARRLARAGRSRAVPAASSSTGSTSSRCRRCTPRRRARCGSPWGRRPCCCSRCRGSCACGACRWRR
jgi:hypothetical protein